MKATSKCPKCGSADILANANVGMVRITSFANPEATVFRDATHTEVSVWVCRGCGYVEFYASHPLALRGPGE